MQRKTRVEFSRAGSFASRRTESNPRLYKFALELCGQAERQLSPPNCDRRQGTLRFRFKIARQIKWSEGSRIQHHPWIKATLGERPSIHEIEWKISSRSTPIPKTVKFSFSSMSPRRAQPSSPTGKQGDQENTEHGIGVFYPLVGRPVAMESQDHLRN